MTGNMLKCVLVLSCLLATVLTQLTPADVQALLRHHQECRSETNVDENLVLGTITGHFSDEPQLKEHLFCMSKKLGMQNEAGEIQRDVVKANIRKVERDPEKVDQIMEKCAIQEADPADTAIHMAMCTYESMHVKK